MRCFKIVLGLAVGLAASCAQAQTLNAAFAGSYSLTNLGTPIGVPPNFGGLTLLAGSSSTLLLGGSANSGSGLFYTVGVTRDGSNHITGFTGTATRGALGPTTTAALCMGRVASCFTRAIAPI